MTKLLLILMMVGLWSGEVRSEVNYVNGKKEGKEVWYYESGKVKGEVNYKEGNGKWIGYYESAKVKVEGNFVDGKKEGKWVWYYENGGRWNGKETIRGAGSKALSIVGLKKIIRLKF